MSAREIVIRLVFSTVSTVGLSILFYIRPRRLPLATLGGFPPMPYTCSCTLSLPVNSSAICLPRWRAPCTPSCSPAAPASR